MWETLRNDRNYLYFALLGALFYIPFLGSVHLFDWDEINFAESAREMIVTGDYFRVRINFQPFWEKPPLFFWLQVASMKVFGINELAARLPNALFGILSLLTLYHLGKKEKDELFGRIWALLFLGSFLPFMYFKSGIIDPVFNYFIFLGTYYLFKRFSSETKQVKYVLLSGLFIGLAVLTKGPVGLLLPLLTWVSLNLLNRFRFLPSWKELLIFMGAIVGVTSLWYGAEIIKNGPWFLTEFIAYQIRLFSTPDAGHAQPIYYHFVVVFLGTFPLSVFALPAFRKSFQSVIPWMKQWNSALFWVVMILFSIVTTKIVHYSSMAYLPLSFLAAATVYNLYSKEVRFSKALRITFLSVGLIFGLLITLLPILLANHEWLLNNVKMGKFESDSLRSIQGISSWAAIFGLLFISSVIYSFFAKSMKKMILVSSFSVAISMFGLLSAIVPGIESFSQRPAIEFFKSLEGKDVYAKTLGYKSYAPYFYFKQPNDPNPNRLNQNWLLEGDIDKPVYIVTKTTFKNKEALKKFELLEEKGGYRLYFRRAE